MFFGKKKLKDGSIPGDGSLYDLGDGKVYQTEDGFTFHPVGDSSILQRQKQSGCNLKELELPGKNVCGMNGTTVGIAYYEEKAQTKASEMFSEIVGYSDIKREFTKALQSDNPVGILLVGPPGCGKSEFLKQIAAAFPEQSLFIDGTYGSKAGIFDKLKDTKPKYVLLDEVDKLDNRDQEALLNLMESGRLTKTTKSEHYDIQLKCWIFATANNKQDLLEPLFDRFERYFLSEYSDEEFKAIAIQRLKKEGIEDEQLSLYIANSVLRGLGRKSFRDAIRIARKNKTIEEVDATIQTMKRYGDMK